MAPKWTILVIVLTVINSGVGKDFTFGGCQPENQTCTECYHKLKESLLKRDINVRKLSVAFFPPKENIPEFVTVTYCFGESCNNSRVWFWTHDSSYLFFPIQTFQYLSLFFGKPAPLFTQNVTLILDEDCHGANNDMFNLLTQRLKNFIQRSSIDPVIDDNYFARAEENDEDILSTPTAKYIISFYAIGFILAIVITIIVLTIYFNTKRWDKKLARNTSKQRKLYKYAKSKIFSIAVTTFFPNLYALILDGFALHTIIKRDTAINEHYVNALPKVVTAVDIAGALVWGTSWMLSFCLWVRPTLTNQQNETFQNSEYVFLALSTLGPFLSFVIHLPYIVIAYLDDASYATSIFIYYTITLFVLFGVLDLTYGTCQGAIIKSKKEQPPNQEEGCYICCPDDAAQIRGLFCVVIPAFAIIILILAGMITALLVVIPISKAFSDVSNRLLGFYQSAIVLIGAYLIYRNFFKKKPSLASAVKKREDYIQTKTVQNATHWERLSRDDRVEEFYARFVDIVANYPIGAQMREEEGNGGREQEGDEGNGGGEGERDGEQEGDRGQEGGDGGEEAEEAQAGGGETGEGAGRGNAGAGGGNAGAGGGNGGEEGGRAGKQERDKREEGGDGGVEAQAGEGEIEMGGGEAGRGDSGAGGGETGTGIGAKESNKASDTEGEGGDQAEDDTTSLLIYK